MTHTEHAPMSRAEHERTPVGMAEVAANLADLARRDLDTIYTAREATTLAHVHAACEVSRALAAAAEAIAYVADPEADPGRTHERDVEGCTTDCEPGPEEPEQFRDSYLCRWCGRDLSEWPDPAALEATCVYRPAGAGATTASRERPTRVVFGPFDDQADAPFDPCGTSIEAIHSRDESEFVVCQLRAGHRTHHVGRTMGAEEIRWPDGGARIHLPTRSIDHREPCGGEGEPECGPAPSPSPFHRCGATPTVVGVESGGCTRIKGHPGEHQAGVPGGGAARWTPEGVSVRYGAGAS